MTNRVTRRDFLADASRATAAATLFHIVPRHVLGRGYLAPSDTLNIACIGAGGKGRSDIDGVASQNIYALCDVDWNAAEDALIHYPKAKRYRDWREMFDKEGKNIDAVTISTPDHNHAIIALAAMKAGKHVFCQKPLARTLGEVRAMMKEAQASKVATQMGNQGHAGEGTRLIRELVEAGAIGQVTEVHYWTNRPIWPQGIDRPIEAFNPPPYLSWDLWLGVAPDRPYAPAYAPFRWRGWWDFGTGALGDIACHSMDAAFWTLSLGTPSRITAETTRVHRETAPKVSRLVYDFPAKGARGPITVLWYDGELTPPRPAELPPEIQWPDYSDVGTQLWIGTEGKLLADAYGDHPILLDAKKQADLTAHPPAIKYPRSAGHYKEWIEAAKKGTQPPSNFAMHAGPLTEMVLFGNLAVRTGQRIDVNTATATVTNATIPEEWITPTYRKGW